MNMEPDEVKPDASAESPDYAVSLLLRQAREAIAAEDSDRALGLATEALELARAQQPLDEVELADAHWILGRVRGLRGELALCQRHLLLALALRRRSREPAQAEVGAALYGLAQVRAGRGGNTRSVWVLLERALAQFEAAPDEGRSPVRAVLHAMGRALHAEGRALLVRPLRERLVAIKQRHLSPQHIEVAATLFDLSTCCQELGDAVGAQRFRSQALDLAEQGSGPEYAALGERISRSARSLRKADRREAIAVLERALAILERALGPTDPRLRPVIMQLKLTHRRADCLPAIEAILRRLLKQGEEALAEDVKLVGILDELAKCLAHQRRFAEAEAVWERSLEILERADGAHADTVRRELMALADLYVRQGAEDLAVPLCRRAIQISALSHGMATDSRAAAMMRAFHARRGEMALAERFARMEIEADEAGFGGRHPEVAISCAKLAELLMDQGRSDEALPHWERALAIWDQLREGPRCGEALRCVEALATIHLRQGHMSEANVFARRLMEQPGLANSWFSEALSRVAQACRAAGKMEAAQALEVRAAELPVASPEGAGWDDDEGETR